MPLGLKISCSLFVLLLVPVYWRQYGPANFLWFSDIALFGAVLALWLESPFLASMQAVSVTALETGWIVDFLWRLGTGRRLLDLTHYMFRSDIPLAVRALSLFHFGLPALLLWMLWRLGYEPHAWIAQTALAWLVLIICYRFTDPAANINWVFGPGKKPQTRVPPGLYLVALMILVPAVVYFPTHLVLAALFGP